MNKRRPPSAVAELLQSQFAYDRVVARQNAIRKAKLKAFLDQHQHASQWAACCAALEDSVRHGVVPTDAMIADTISRCGTRGKLEKAKELYTAFYKRIGRSRPPAVHRAFMTACAQSADFAEAHRQFLRLLAFDRSRLKKDPKHLPLINDDITTEYLRAALAASVQQAVASPSVPPSKAAKDSPDSSTEAPWAVALSTFVAVRRDPALLKFNGLTPLLMESATQLAEVGGQWELCLRLLKRAAQEQRVIPPESYDAAIRACYHHKRHKEVVSLMQQLVATKTPPDERSVRLALVSTEELTAQEKAAGAVDGATSMAGWALSLQLLEAMRLNGIPLYQQSYEAPLRTCAMAGQWERALEVLDAMRRDSRPISTQLYRTALAARMEACDSVEQVERFLRLPVATEGGASAVMYMAALRCCMRLRHWSGFDKIHREMVNREMPETFDKMRLLIEAAYERGNYHGVLVRFARFDSVAGYERKRVEQPDSFVHLHEEDFAIPDRLLDMVFESYNRAKDSAKDPIVEVAYRAAVKRREARAGPMLDGREAGAPDGMFSREARRAGSPSAFL